MRNYTAGKFDPMINPLPSKVKEVLDNEVFKAAISADDFWAAKGVTLDIVMGSGIKERDKMRILNNIETIEAEGASTTALLQYLYNSYLKYIGLGITSKKIYKEEKMKKENFEFKRETSKKTAQEENNEYEEEEDYPEFKEGDSIGFHGREGILVEQVGGGWIVYFSDIDEETLIETDELREQHFGGGVNKMKNRAVVPQGRFFQRRRSEPRTDLERVMNHYDVSEEDAIRMLETTSAEELLPERGTGRSEFSKKTAQENELAVFFTKLIDDQNEYEAVVYIKATNVREARQKAKQDEKVQEYLQDGWKLRGKITELVDSVEDLDPTEIEALKEKDVYVFEPEFREASKQKKTAQEEDNILFKNIVQRIKDLGGKEGIPQEVIEEYIDSLYGGFEPEAYNRDMSDEDLLGDIKLFWREVEHEEGSLIDEAFKSRLVRALVKDFIKVASEKDLQKVKDSETTQELFASLKDVVKGDTTEYLSNVWNLYKLEKDSKGDIIEKFAQDELPPMGWTVDVKKDEEASEEEKEEKEEEGVSELPELPPMPEWEVTEFEEKEKVAPIEIRIKPGEKQIDVDFNAEEETPEETKEEMERKEEETEGEKKEDLDEIESPTTF